MIKALFNRRTKAKALLAVFVLLLTAWLPTIPTPANAAIDGDDALQARWYERATFYLRAGHIEDSNFEYDASISTNDKYAYEGVVTFKNQTASGCPKYKFRVIINKSDLDNTNAPTPIESATAVEAVGSGSGCPSDNVKGVEQFLDGDLAKILNPERLKETYKYVAIPAGSAPTHILVDGGHLRGSGVNLEKEGSFYKGTVKLTSGCTAVMKITPTGATTGRVVLLGPNPPSAIKCTSQEVNDLNEEDVTINANGLISGLGPVTVTSQPAYGGGGANYIPNTATTDTITISQNGDERGRKDVVVDTTSGYLVYTTSFDNVAPGTYAACSRLAENCVSFTKTASTTPTVVIPGKNDPIVGDAQNNNSTGTANTGVGCDNGGFSLAWVVCPLLESVKGLVEDAFNVVVLPLLRVSPLTQSSSIKPIWENFRDLTNVLFVLLFIVVIFSNAISSIDAYTIKKVLPKLVAAAILVQASYFICGIVIDIANVSGSGVAGFINSTVLSGGSGGGVSGGATQSLVGGLFSVLTVGAGALAVVSLSLWPFLLPIGLSLVIGLLAFVFTLITRQVILNSLIVISPLAVMAWVLPNTERYFKMWWSNFAKLAMMYPLIILFLGMARVFAEIATAGGAGGIQAVIGLVAPIAAFFMVPATFKMSGSMMGQVAGAIQKRSSGIKSRTVEPLRKSMKENVQAKNALTLGEGGRFRRGLTRVGSGHTFSFGDVGARKMAAAKGAAEAAIRKDNNEILRTEAPTNKELGQALQSGMVGGKMVGGKMVGGKKMDKYMRQAALERLMENKGAPEYAEFRVGLEDDKGNFDAAKAAKQWGMSEKEANLVWTNAHEGSNGGWAVSAGFRPDGFKGVDAADVSTFAGYRQERIKNFIDRKANKLNADGTKNIYYEPSAGASMMANIANDFDARAKVSRDAMVHLKNRTTVGHADYSADLASQVVEINGNKMTMAQYTANHIDDQGVITVPQPPSTTTPITLGPTPITPTPATPIAPTPPTAVPPASSTPPSPSPAPPPPPPGSTTTSSGIVVPPARRTRAPRPVIYTPSATTSQAAVNNASDRMQAAIAAGDEQLRQTNVRNTSQAYENTGAMPPQPTPESIDQINQNLAPGTVIQPSIQPDDETPPTT